MATFGEITDLDLGFILIEGPRRCGKTHLCEEFLRRWDEKRRAYRYFSPRRLTPMPSGNWKSSFGANLDVRGCHAALIDEPGKNLRPEYIEHLRLLVIATSEPTPWMALNANWMIRFSAPRQFWIDPGKPLPGSPILRLSIWERLSADDWCI